MRQGALERPSVTALCLTCRAVLATLAARPRATNPSINGKMTNNGAATPHEKKNERGPGPAQPANFRALAESQSTETEARDKLISRGEKIFERGSAAAPLT